MRIGDVMLALNAPAGLRRLAVIISVIVAFLWCIYFQDEVGDFLDLSPSEWLTFFIGLGVGAFATPLALGLYYSLPPLGADRRWEYGLLVLGVVTALALMGWLVVYEPNVSDHLLAVMSFLLGIAVAPLVVVKVFVWLLKGTRQ